MQRTAKFIIQTALLITTTFQFTACIRHPASPIYPAPEPQSTETRITPQGETQHSPPAGNSYDKDDSVADPQRACQTTAGSFTPLESIGQMLGNGANSSPRSSPVSQDQKKEALVFWAKAQKAMEAFGIHAKIPMDYIANRAREDRLDLFKTFNLASSNRMQIEKETLWELFYDLSLFESGRDSLRRFLPQFLAGRLPIEVSNAYATASAYEIAGRRIVFSPQRFSKAEMMIMLSHEGVHAGDLLRPKRAMLQAKAPFSFDLSAFLSLSAEHRAYRNNFALAREIINNAGASPSLPSIVWWHASRTEDGIIDHFERGYKFSPSATRDYFHEHPWNEPMERLWNDDLPDRFSRI